LSAVSRPVVRRRRRRPGSFGKTLSHDPDHAIAGSHSAVRPRSGSEPEHRKGSFPETGDPEFRWPRRHLRGRSYMPPPEASKLREHYRQQAIFPEPLRRSNRLGRHCSGLAVVAGGGSRWSFGKTLSHDPDQAIAGSHSAVRLRSGSELKYRKR
jgi:hypothetical protein